MKFNQYLVKLKHYVDDLFVLMKSNTVNGFLTKFDLYPDNIEFTYEPVAVNKLAFLNVLTREKQLD